jgi:hypothetical protein
LQVGDSRLQRNGQTVEDVFDDLSQGVAYDREVGFGAILERRRRRRRMRSCSATPAKGHLFFDASLLDYDEQAAARLTERVLHFRD